MKKIFLFATALVALVSWTAPLLASAQTMIDYQPQQVGPRSNAGGSGSDFSNFNASNYSIQNSGGACSSITSTGIPGVVGCIITFFDYFVYVIVALSVVYTIIGAFNMIASEEKREDGKKTVYYGIIALFVMMSIWGFVNILQSTFNLGRDADDVSRPAIIPSR